MFSVLIRISAILTGNGQNYCKMFGSSLLTFAFIQRENYHRKDVSFDGVQQLFDDEEAGPALTMKVTPKDLEHSAPLIGAYFLKIFPKLVV